MRKPIARKEQQTPIQSFRGATWKTLSLTAFPKLCELIVEWMKLLYLIIADDYRVPMQIWRALSNYALAGHRGCSSFIFTYCIRIVGFLLWTAESFLVWEKCVDNLAASAGSYLYHDSPPAKQCQGCTHMALRFLVSLRWILPICSHLAPSLIGHTLAVIC